MKLLFYLGHPAHYHLLKNTIAYFKNGKNEVVVLIKKKDILEELCQQNNLDYINILPEGKGTSRFATIYSLLKRDYRIYKLIRKNRPELLIGSEASLTHVGKLLNIPSIILSEDDAEYISGFAKLAFPFVSHILSPQITSAWKWEHKKIGYNSYHELAYLHPNHFNPDAGLIKDCIDTDKPFFILRFSKLEAYHDKGTIGITDVLAFQIIDFLKDYGNIYINSERKIPPQLEKYRLTLPSKYMHHALKYCKLLICDSQTMAAEAAVLGTPSIRFNGHVGKKIAYLNELEEKYNLTFGVMLDNPNSLIYKIQEIISTKSDHNKWQTRQNEMLQDKIDLSAFLTWFIQEYPSSVTILKNDPNYQYNFK